MNTDSCSPMVRIVSDPSTCFPSSEVSTTTKGSPSAPYNTLALCCRNLAVMAVGTPCRSPRDVVHTICSGEGRNANDNGYTGDGSISAADRYLPRRIEVWLAGVWFVDNANTIWHYREGLP